MCTDCNRAAAIDVTTGITRLQCDAHLAGNARRSAAAKRRVRDTLTVALCAVALSVSVVACESAVNDPSTYSQGVAGSPAYQSAAGSPAMPEPEPLITITYDAGPPPAPPVVVVTPPPVAGSPAPTPEPDPQPPVVVTPPVAGSPAPPPPPAPPPAPPPVHATKCQLDVGGVVDCNNANFRNSQTWHLNWQIDASKPIGSYNSTGCGADPATVTQCTVGARCEFFDAASDYSQKGTCI